MFKLFPKAAVFAAWAIVLAAGAVQAETYTLLIFETPADLAARQDSGKAGQAYWNAFNAYATSLQTVGALRGGSAFVVRGGVATVDAKGSRPSPLLASKRRLGGYFVVEAADMAAAEALAKQAPAVLHGAVEIHQNAPNPTMAAH